MRWCLHRHLATTGLTNRNERTTLMLNISHASQTVLEAPLDPQLWDNIARATDNAQAGAGFLAGLALFTLAPFVAGAIRNPLPGRLRLTARGKALFGVLSALMMISGVWLAGESWPQIGSGIGEANRLATGAAAQAYTTYHPGGRLLGPVERDVAARSLTFHALPTGSLPQVCRLQDPAGGPATLTCLTRASATAGNLA
jgi:hypothetical protein